MPLLGIRATRVRPLIARVPAAAPAAVAASTAGTAGAGAALALTLTVSSLLERALRGGD